MDSTGDAANMLAKKSRIKISSLFIENQKSNGMMKTHYS